MLNAPFISSTLFNAPSVKEDSGLEALKLLSSKLLVYDIKTFIEPDGGGAGGQVICHFFLAKASAPLHFVLALELDVRIRAGGLRVWILILCVIHRTGMPRERNFGA